MSIETIINYDTPGNFTFDSNKVEFVGSVAKLKNLETATNFEEQFADGVGKTFDSNLIEFVAGKAQLKLQGSTGNTFNQPFTSDSGFTYNSSKTEFVAGKAQQKDVTPANSIVGANYNSTTNASWHKSGSVTGTLIGSPTLNGGKLDCDGNINDGVYYDVTNDGQAAIKFKYTPNYSGNPPNNVDVVGIREPSGNANRISLTHSPSGDNWRIWLYDSAGSSKYVATVIGSSGVGLVAGTEYEIELNWDNVAGTIRIFMDGVLYGTLTPGAWSFTANAARLGVGSGILTYNKTDAKFDDVVLFDSVQHTTSYTPGYTVSDTIYEADVVSIPAFVYSGSGNILAFTDFIATVGNNAKLTINDLYWNGSAWVASSDTYATSSSPTDIDTNIASLPPTNTVNIKVLWDNGNSQMDIDDLTLEYTDQIYPMTNPDIVIDAAIVATATGENLVALNSFTPVVTETGSDLVKYVLSDDNGATYKYWDGAAWSVSSGYSESNIGSDINTNLATFPITSSGVKIKLYLHSEDGSTTPGIDNLILNYDDFIYASDDPVIIVVTGLVMEGLEGFSDSITTPVNTSIKYIISVDSVSKYWDGAAWVNSDDTFAQANTAAEIETNKASLDLSSGPTVKFKTLLNSDGTDTPEITSITVDYNFFNPIPGPIDQCIVYCNVEDVIQDSTIDISTTKFIVENQKPFSHSNRVIAFNKYESAFNATGYSELSVIETVSVDKKLNFYIEYVNSDAIVKTIKFTPVSVPNQDSINIVDLTKVTY